MFSPKKSWGMMMKKTKIPPKTAQRAYAVASFIITTLRGVSEEAMGPKLAKVHHQAVQAMRVFVYKSDKQWFAEFIDKLGEIWEKVGNRYGVGVKIENAPMLAEALQYMIPDNEFKQFFATTKYYNPESYEDPDFRKSCLISADLSDEISALTGARPVSELLPKKKAKKEKKPREKSKKQKLHEKREAEARERKAKREETRQKLREIVAAAKAKAKAEGIHA